jgi:pimeloyl-ACP methyl ester carboxylesterase
MSDFLLIHGSCHGAWCWRDLIPALRTRGHSARAIDLPSHGSDGTPLADVTLDMYAEAILKAMKGPTIVVGHSMAGFPISRAAELDPTNFERLVYVCAYAPRNGMGLADMRREAPYQPLMQAVIKAPDGISFGIDPAQARDVFYHDCPPETVAFALTRLGQQPIKPQETPIEIGENYASVPKSYIRCDDDRTIPPEYQRTMTEGWPERDVYAMDCSHSPFFADPTRLAGLLNKIAAGE